MCPSTEDPNYFFRYTGADVVPKKPYLSFTTTRYVPRRRLTVRVSALPFVLYVFNGFQEPDPRWRWTWKVQNPVPLFGLTSTRSFDLPLTAFAVTNAVAGAGHP